MYTPCVLALGVITVRHEEMAWGRDMPGQDPHLPPSFSDAYSISGILHFNRSTLQQDNEISMETEYRLSPRGVK